MNFLFVQKSIKQKSKRKDSVRTNCVVRKPLIEEEEEKSKNQLSGSTMRTKKSTNNYSTYGFMVLKKGL